MAEEKTNEREKNAIEKVNSYKKYDFRYVPTIQIVLLTIFTCGFYTYYLIYKWVEMLQTIDEEDMGLTNPIAAALISFFSCGIGGVYFQYKIPERAEYFARKTAEDKTEERRNLRPPIKDLPLIALLGNLAAWIFTFIGLIFTAGILNLLAYPFLFAFYSWLHVVIQRSIEYTLCIKKPDYM
tara:strand:- start:159 stop:704 length:546 start_codon:yes stop_codon:yes gene_type:complete